MPMPKAAEKDKGRKRSRRAPAPLGGQGAHQKKKKEKGAQPEGKRIVKSHLLHNARKKGGAGLKDGFLGKTY